MGNDDDLAEVDAILKALRVSTLAIASRAFDPEVTELEDGIERARLLVAKVRLELAFLKERLE